ncbi:P-loop containing nucleoside triphosphate hydrolase protein [Plenodomus tracheiphilus IPT5]|uniref:P-loop containing nucleoside triphosphate hydrolase protein n=1 Tax=Plenodomus tracheiphilus IPT5 TaxID=1408161 RepID=A0A6A7B9J4_9PLEO|nr:P-loop containing nucleoside triphosphate hydrolase protein [Plenodomus tracheiphilus IPT5]
MIFSQRQDPGQLLRVFSRHLGRSRHFSVCHRPHATNNQLICTVGIFNGKYSSHISFAQRAARTIATESNTSSREAFIPSPEQQAIVKLCNTQNVVVSARPGAGKTATAEAIIAADPNRPIAIITYSKRLQLGTARRLSAYPGSDVFTFHGLAGQLFPTTVHNDSILRSLRKQGDVPAWTGIPYEIVILDELQDCTDDLFWLICAFISAVTHAAGGKAPQIVVLGDERQAIYEFRGADARYLSLSSAAMTALSPYQWTHLALSKSFRLSHENTAFVNNVFLGGEEYIVGSHNGPKPIYLYGNAFDADSVSRHLVPLIQEYGPECTAILAPSVRQNPQLSLLTNYLSEFYGIPVAVSIADDIPLDDKVLRGKICVSTYHQFKGNERDLVIVYGVDAGYFEFLGRDLPDDTCPNTTFVALTRARKQLVVVHHERNDPMPFIDTEELHETAEFVHLKGEEAMPVSMPPGRPLQLGLLLPKNASASDMSRHILDEEIEAICSKHLQIHQVQPPLPDSLHIDAPSTVVTDSIKKHHEAVSDLNGLAVVAAYEHALLGTLTSLGATKKLLLQHPFPSDTEAQAVWLCREACRYEAKVSGYKSRQLQMKSHSFAWLGAYLNAARERLEAQFPTSAMLDFEVKLEEEDFCVANPLGGNDQTTFVRGRADIIRYEEVLNTSSAISTRKKERRSIADMDLDHVSIWEIKFVAKLSLQHAIQACIYAYLFSYKHKRPIPPRIILFNVRDGEKWDIVPRDGVASLRRVVEETLIAKYSTNNTLTTDEFLKKCAKTKAEVEKSFAKSK